MYVSRENHFVVENGSTELLFLCEKYLRIRSVPFIEGLCYPDIIRITTVHVYIHQKDTNSPSITAQVYPVITVCVFVWCYLAIRYLACVSSGTYLFMYLY